MPEDAYWEHIEQYFVKKRGSALLLSPKDWPLIRSWQERKVPLDVIYDGIDRAFERLEKNEPLRQRWAIRSLTFCQREVESAWENWKREHASASQESTQETFVSERRKLAVKLQNTIALLRKYAGLDHYQCVQENLLIVINTLETFLPRIHTAEEDMALLVIKEQICECERSLLDRLEQTIPDETRQTLYARAEARLASHKRKMKTSVYQETLHLAFLQELRTAYPFPPFL
ncbi:MAG: hypothetical protein RBT80_08255 [Candidatus Vecturithrix sp.]|jgi:hypothetical protein|nr:hypothetical protein [Candidatus Vecturithrix sp.]